MEKIDRVVTDDGKKIIEILRDKDGTFVLHKYACQYDVEEETAYEVRIYPDPDGRFGCLDQAILEAKRILELM